MQIGSHMTPVMPALPPATAGKPVSTAESSGPAAASEDDAKLQAQRQQQAEQQNQQRESDELASRDREVRAHEQAHAAVGGQYAGAPSYSFKRGPDGKLYAVGGEVSIDISSVAGDPQATLRKMEVVMRAALAPAEPSAQDRQVAAQASARMAEARAQLRMQQQAAQSSGSGSGLALYGQVAGDSQPAALVDVQA